jgi:hypothetical protein
MGRGMDRRSMSPVTSGDDTRMSNRVEMGDLPRDRCAAYTQHCISTCREFNIASGYTVYACRFNFFLFSFFLRFLFLPLRK